MSRYHFTARAIDDVTDIWSFIASDDREAADRVEEAIYRACAMLAHSPYAGRTRNDLTNLPVRIWVGQSLP